MYQKTFCDIFMVFSQKRGYINYIMGRKGKSYKLTRANKSVLDNYLENELGRPCEYSEQIGAFICIHISMGWTVEKICNKFNELAGKKILHRVKIYRWLNNPKLKDFNDKFYYARELAAQGILDEIINLESDIENLTLDSKAGRVILESLRWRAKVQNPDYFNPVQRQEIQADHRFIIVSSVPEPRALDEKDILDAEYISD